MLIGKNVKVIFLLGGPGSDKVVQGRRIAAKYGLTFLSTGELLRADIARGSEGGKRLQRLLAQGEFVSLTDIMNLLKEAIRVNAAGSPGFIIEGFPRDAEQAAKFTTEVAPCHAVIFLDIPEALMKDRLLKRNQYVDSKTMINSKLRLYKGRTQPMIDEFVKRGLVIKINGIGTEDEIFERMLRGLTNFMVSRARQRKSTSSLSVKPGNLPANLESISVVSSSLPSRNSLSQSKDQPEVWRRSDWIYRNGIKLTSRGQNMSVVNSDPHKVSQVGILPKDEPHPRTMSRVRTLLKSEQNQQTSPIEPLHRHEQHPQTSRFRLSAKNEQHLQTSRVESSQRHETHPKTASRVEPLYRHEQHSLTSRFRLSAKNGKYLQTSRVEPSHRHQTHPQMSQVEPSHRQETHPQTSQIEPSHRQETHPRTSQVEPSHRHKSPALKKYLDVMTSKQTTGSRIVEKR